MLREPRSCKLRGTAKKKKKGQRERVAKEPAKLKGQMEEKTQKAEGNPFQSLPSLMPLTNRQLTRQELQEKNLKQHHKRWKPLEQRTTTGILEQMNKMWKSKGKKNTELQAEILTRRNGRK